MLNEDLLQNSNIVIENRSKLSVTGVNEVDGFDSECVVFHTVLGQLTVRGKSLKLTGLENGTGVLTVEGSIHGVVYTNDRQKSGIFGKLFR